jgi:phosphopentomutase
MVFGEQNQYQIASSIGVSLPSYQALMVGHANECRNNQCGQIKEETLLEKIKKNLCLNIGDVISLVDSDENGHLNDYPGYIKTLRTYDNTWSRLSKHLRQWINMELRLLSL